MIDNPITRKEKYLAKLTGSYTGNVPDPITRVEKYLYDLCQKGISGLTPEEIENAVNKYLKENPVQPGATEEQAQQIKQNTDDVALLKEDLSNKITKFYASNQGETHITDSDNGKIQDMMLYGKSEQKRYSGKNLLNATLQTTTQNGVTCTANGDGTYTINGTATSDTLFHIGYFIFEKDTKYKIVGCPQGGSLNTLYRLDGSLNANSDTGNGIVYSGDGNKRNARIVVFNGATVNNLLFKPMITTDLTATYDDFEPYTGGIPSPNPDYPQEIKSVVNPTVKVCGKNLLEDGSLKSDNNGKIEYISAGKIKVTSSISAWYAAITNTLKLTPNTNYVLSAKCDSSNGNITCNSVSITGAYIKCAFLTDSDGLATISIRCRYESAESRFVYSDLQLEKGSTATAYEPYTEQTVTLPYTLNAIPVNSGGNVTIDGQQYIADYVDVERGKLVRMCKEYVITGSERLAMYWLGNASYLRNVCCINNFENIVLYDGINPLAMSDMFIGKISENADDERAIYLMLRGSGDKTLAIKFLDSDGITTVDLAKQWLIEHKPKIVFVLSTSEEIDLTPEENEAFKALATYYPTTNIFANSEQLDGYTVFNYPISMANIITSLKTKTENLESANYTDRGTLADTDAFLINDGTGMKKSVLSKLSDFVLNKIADKVFAKLQTNDKTILGAINELNSKTPNCTYMSPQVMINSNAWCEIATFSSNIWNRSFFTLVCGGDICAINYGHERDSNEYLSRCNAIWLTNKDIKVGFKVLDNILHIYIKNDRVTRFISICCLGLCTENDITSFKLRNTTLEDADMDKIY